MSASRTGDLLRALADGLPLGEAATAAGYADAEAAAAALRKLAGRRRTAAAKEQEPLPPVPPKRSPYPAGATAVAHADGASRGNPGPAAFGVVYLLEDIPVCAEGEAIGRTTNNVAEYRGAIAALQRLLDWKVTGAVLRLDSQLVVRQMEGRYRVKEPTLQKLHAEATALAARFDRLRFEHVPRAQNALADRVANAALDG